MPIAGQNRWLTIKINQFKKKDQMKTKVLLVFLVSGFLSAMAWADHTHWGLCVSNWLRAYSWLVDDNYNGILTKTYYSYNQYDHGQPLNWLIATKTGDGPWVYDTNTTFSVYRASGYYYMEYGNSNWCTIYESGYEQGHLDCGFPGTMHSRVWAEDLWEMNDLYQCIDEIYWESSHFDLGTSTESKYPPGQTAYSVAFAWTWAN
jgi:hypothetical protein